MLTVACSAVEDSDDEDAGGQNESADEDVGDVPVQKKIGAKKLAKLQRKEEAKQYRQVLKLKVSLEVGSYAYRHSTLQAEEERKAQRKAREEKEERERIKRKQEEEEQERLEREEEERRKKEREQREIEEFNKWKGLIEVDAVGSVKAELEEKQAKLLHFADHVKKEKVVLLEDLAITFGLQTQVGALHVCNDPTTWVLTLAPCRR